MPVPDGGIVYSCIGISCECLNSGTLSLEHKETWSNGTSISVLYRLKSSAATGHAMTKRCCRLLGSRDETSTRPSDLTRGA